tara:strand:- start:79 stop:504 length:426 start_codon:yes stop_codon:yes gene_type:complete
MKESFCSKCKKKRNITNLDYKPNGKDIYKFCISCRDRNTEECRRKKERLLTISKEKKKCYCMRCQIPLNYIKDKQLSHCEVCKEYLATHARNKRKKYDDGKHCTRCSKIKDDDDYKTCINCREIDSYSYYKNKKIRESYNI